MPWYAHALIELADGSRVERGEVVPDNVDGLDELKDAGSVREDEYDPASDVPPPPQFVEIDGVRYERKESPDA